MEESDEMLRDGAVGHAVPLESFETEQNANNPELKSEEKNQQGDGSCNNEERSRETINLPGKEPMAMAGLGMWLYPTFRCYNYALEGVPKKPQTIEMALLVFECLRTRGNFVLDQSALLFTFLS